MTLPESESNTVSHPALIICRRRCMWIQAWQCHLATAGQGAHQDHRGGNKVSCHCLRARTILHLTCPDLLQASLYVGPGMTGAISPR